MPFIPHTKEETKAMLAAIGVTDMEDLFAEIPAHLRTKAKSNIPVGLTEMEVARLMCDFAAKDGEALCFIGAGAYEHHIPAAVWELAGRGEFLTAYTPYQAEASQGGLQVIYEYQTMMAELMGMDVSNASLYEGASALAEAVLMAVRCNRKAKSRRILVVGTLHPHYRDVVNTIVSSQQIELVSLPYCTDTGVTVPEALHAYEHDDPFAALVIPQPNFFGQLEDVDAMTRWAHGHGVLVIACVNPVAMALLKEPGQWGCLSDEEAKEKQEHGADIVCGEGQPLGIPLSSGGPYFGFLCCKQNYVRQMPGRIVGRTTDMEGKQSFTLTLQAREQHIRRSKATSNICTNQGLMVIAATIYLSLMGFVGLQRVASACFNNTKRLIEKLTAIDGVELVFDGPKFHEAVLRLPVPVAPVLETLAASGIQGGYDLAEQYPELGHCLLVCATETKTEEDLERYAAQLAKECS